MLMGFRMLGYEGFGKNDLKQELIAALERKN
jgi:hypothetical protein